MRKEVYEGIYHGDELEWCGESKEPDWIRNRNPIAWYSERHTPYNKLEGRISFRISSYDYGPSEGNSHSLPAIRFRLKEQPYDPTQMGDKEDDI
jgi:hypothetical protein